MLQPSPAAESKIGGNIIVLKENFYFPCSINLTLLSPIKGNSTNDCDFF